MYFWNIEALKAQILAGQFTSGKVFPYLIITMSFYSIAFEIFLYDGYEEQEINYLTYSSSVICTLILVLGTFYVYHANGGASGKNFAAKYIGIGFIVTIRFLVYAMPLIVAIVVHRACADANDEYAPTTFLEMAVSVTWSVACYLRMAKHIRDTAVEGNEPA